MIAASSISQLSISSGYISIDGDSEIYLFPLKIQQILNFTVELVY